MHRTAVAASLSFALVVAAESAAAPSAVAGDDGPCESVLLRLAEVSESRSYSVDPGTSGFMATLGEVEIQARCSGGLLELLLCEADGSAVSVAFSHNADQNLALELLGEFPGIGTVSRTAIIDGSTDPLTGSLTFAADAGGDLVLVDFELWGADLTVGGEPPGDDEASLINAAFAPTLRTSASWKEAHVLAYAAAGVWDEIAVHESRFDMISELAIPSPDAAAKVDGDSKDAVQKCGVSFAVCLAAAWLPPAGAWACGVALANCFASLPCLPSDCAGDGV